MAGMYVWERYKLRVRVLEEWQKILLEISGQISYSAESMSQICRQIEEASTYGKRFWRDISIQMEEKKAGLPGNIWKNNLCKYNYWEILSAEDKRIIYQFGESFGTLDIYSQVNEIKLYEKRIEHNVNEARQKMIEQKKVCLFMGIISGMMAGICLL